MRLPRRLAGYTARTGSGRKVAARTVCRWLSPGQQHDYQAWIDNDRRLRDLLARLEALGAAAFEADPISLWSYGNPRSDEPSPYLGANRCPSAIGGSVACSLRWFTRVALEELRRFPEIREGQCHGDGGA